MAASIDFPNNRDILWDRTAISKVSLLKAGDVIPPLYISAVSVLSILEELNSTDTTIERISVVQLINQLDKKQSTSQIPLKSIIGLHTSVLKIDGNFFEEQRQSTTNVESSLTIPISPRSLSDFGLSFEKDSTLNLIINLGKAVRACRNTTLRSCVRIRAAGSVQRHDSSLNGTLRFEAILPDNTFQVQQIPSIPVLSTALSLKLAKRTSSGSHTGGPPQVGYVTLNQTRKIVPLLENDPAVSLTPLVGVWTAFDESESPRDLMTQNSYSQNTEHSQEIPNLSNPLTWAILVRFLFNEHIKDRVFAGGDTCLLVNFGETRVDCFEVKKITPHTSSSASSSSSSSKERSGNRSDSEHSFSSPALSNSEDFLCLDFTVDLDIPSDSRGSPIGQLGTIEPIICKFRPLRRTEDIKAFRSCHENNIPGNYTENRVERTVSTAHTKIGNDRERDKDKNMNRNKNSEINGFNEEIENVNGRERGGESGRAYESTINYGNLNGKHQEKERKNSRNSAEQVPPYKPESVVKNIRRNESGRGNENLESSTPVPRVGIPTPTQGSYHRSPQTVPHPNVHPTHHLAGYTGYTEPPEYSLQLRVRSDEQSSSENSTHTAHQSTVRMTQPRLHSPSSSPSSSSHPHPTTSHLSSSSHAPSSRSPSQPHSHSSSHTSPPSSSSQASFSASYSHSSSPGHTHSSTHPTAQTSSHTPSHTSSHKPSHFSNHSTHPHTHPNTHSSLTSIRPSSHENKTHPNTEPTRASSSHIRGDVISGSFRTRVSQHSLSSSCSHVPSNRNVSTGDRMFKVRTHSGGTNSGGTNSGGTSSGGTSSGGSNRGGKGGISGVDLVVADGGTFSYKSDDSMKSMDVFETKRSCYSPQMLPQESHIRPNMRRYSDRSNDEVNAGSWTAVKDKSDEMGLSDEDDGRERCGQLYYSKSATYSQSYSQPFRDRSSADLFITQQSKIDRLEAEVEELKVLVRSLTNGKINENLSVKSIQELSSARTGVRAIYSINGNSKSYSYGSDENYSNSGNNNNNHNDEHNYNENSAHQNQYLRSKNDQKISSWAGSENQLNNGNTIKKGSFSINRNIDTDTNEEGSKNNRKYNSYYENNNSERNNNNDKKDNNNNKNDKNNNNNNDSNNNSNKSNDNNKVNHYIDNNYQYLDAHSNSIRQNLTKHENEITGNGHLNTEMHQYYENSPYDESEFVIETLSESVILQNTKYIPDISVDNVCYVKEEKDLKKGTNCGTYGDTIQDPKDLRNSSDVCEMMSVVLDSGNINDSDVRNNSNNDFNNNENGIYNNNNVINNRNDYKNINNINNDSYNNNNNVNNNYPNNNDDQYNMSYNSIYEMTGNKYGNNNSKSLHGVNLDTQLGSALNELNKTKNHDYNHNSNNNNYNNNNNNNNNNENTNKSSNYSNYSNSNYSNYYNAKGISMNNRGDTHSTQKDDIYTHTTEVDSNSNMSSNNNNINNKNNSSSSSSSGSGSRVHVPVNPFAPAPDPAPIAPSSPPPSSSSAPKSSQHLQAERTERTRNSFSEDSAEQCEEGSDRRTYTLGTFRTANKAQHGKGVHGLGSAFDPGLGVEGDIYPNMGALLGARTGSGSGSGREGLRVGLRSDGSDAVPDGSMPRHHQQQQQQQQEKQQQQQQQQQQKKQRQQEKQQQQLQQSHSRRGNWDGGGERDPRQSAVEEMSHEQCRESRDEEHDHGSARQGVEDEEEEEEGREEEGDREEEDREEEGREEEEDREEMRERLFANYSPPKVSNRNTLSDPYGIPPKTQPGTLLSFNGQYGTRSENFRLEQERNRMKKKIAHLHLRNRNTFPLEIKEGGGPGVGTGLGTGAGDGTPHRPNPLSPSSLPLSPQPVSRINMAYSPTLPLATVEYEQASVEDFSTLESDSILAIQSRYL